MILICDASLTEKNILAMTQSNRNTVNIVNGWLYSSTFGYILYLNTLNLLIKNYYTRTYVVCS